MTLTLIQSEKAAEDFSPATPSDSSGLVFRLTVLVLVESLNDRRSRTTLSFLDGHELARASVPSASAFAHWITPCERERLSRTPEAPSAPRGGQGNPEQGFGSQSGFRMAGQESSQFKALSPTSKEPPMRQSRLRFATCNQSG